MKYAKVLAILFLIFSFTLCSGIALAAKPGIKITSVSAYGDTNGYVIGKVVNLAKKYYANYKVAGYIQVDDNIWTKPTLANPLTEIKSDSTFTFDITTGGCDAYAFKVFAYLVPADIDLETIKCFPCGITFKPEQAIAKAIKSRTPKKRVISFAGRKWDVKRRDCPSGPGGNYFGNTSKNVQVTKKGGLYLRINQGDGGRWNCAEVILKESLGYGVYRIVTNSRVDELDSNVILGLFTWDTEACDFNNREIDFEFARWGDDAEYTNAQYVIQPCDACPGCADNCERFRVDLADDDKLLTQFLIWTSQKAHFMTFKGNYLKIPEGITPVHEWVYSGVDLPEPGKENFRFNLWLLGGNPPRDGKPVEVLVKDFSFSLYSEKPAITIVETGGGWASGTMTGNPDLYQVEIYIKVRGKWWTKPYWSDPLTPINFDGTWKCNINTGGVDREASQVAAFLVPKGSTARLAGGHVEIPAEVFADAVAYVYFDIK